MKHYCKIFFALNDNRLPLREPYIISIQNKERACFYVLLDFFLQPLFISGGTTYLLPIFVCHFPIVRHSLHAGIYVIFPKDGSEICDLQRHGIVFPRQDLEHPLIFRLET